MSFEQKFSRQIDSFQRYGTYQYKYDEVGNSIFNSSSMDFSQVYLAFPLSNFVYNNSKILEFYDPEFVEFLPSSSAMIEKGSLLQSELEDEKAKNATLSQQLENLLLTSEISSNDASRLAAKQVILELRKALGQGRVDSDFSDDFPYAPIRKDANIITDTATRVSKTTTQIVASTGGGVSPLPDTVVTTGGTTNTGASTIPTTPTISSTTPTTPTVTPTTFTPSRFGGGGGANKYLQQN